MASVTRIKTYTQAEVFAIARKAKRDPASVTNDELRALAMFLIGDGTEEAA